MIGIIALLIGLLLPALAVARRHANTVKCAANQRQLCYALQAYASCNRQQFPLNLSAPPGRFWCDLDRLGDYLSAWKALPQGIGGGVFACPSDPNSLRSYAMNVWGSSKSDATGITANPKIGERWGPNVSKGSQIILVVESWSSEGSMGTSFYAQPTVGIAGSTPGQRFGVGGGIPGWTINRFGTVKSEIDFSRHRSLFSFPAATDPVGRVNIGYVDGHVELKPSDRLASSASGLSTLDTLWTPLDFDLNK